MGLDDALADVDRQVESAGRLRLRDLRGAVVFDAAKPNQRPHGDPDEEVQEAARGEVVRKLTRLNADQVDAHSIVLAPASA